MKLDRCIFSFPPNSSLETEQHNRTCTTCPTFPDLPINWGFSSCWCRLNRANPGALGCSGSVFHWVQQKKKKKVKSGLESGPAHWSRGTDQKVKSANTTDEMLHSNLWMPFLTEARWEELKGRMWFIAYLLFWYRDSSSLHPPPALATSLLI